MLEFAYANGRSARSKYRSVCWRQRRSPALKRPVRSAVASSTWTANPSRGSMFTSAPPCRWP